MFQDTHQYTCSFTHANTDITHVRAYLKNAAGEHAVIGDHHLQPSLIHHRNQHFDILVFLKQQTGSSGRTDNHSSNRQGVSTGRIKRGKCISQLRLIRQ